MTNISINLLPTIGTYNRKNVQANKPEAPVAKPTADFNLLDLTHNRVMVNKSKLSFKGINLTKTEAIVNSLVFGGLDSGFKLNNFTSVIFVGKSHSAIAEKADTIAGTLNNVIDKLFFVKDEKVKNPFVVIIEKVEGLQNNKIVNLSEDEGLKINGEHLYEAESVPFDISKNSTIESDSYKIRMFNDVEELSRGAKEKEFQSHSDVPLTIYPLNLKKRNTETLTTEQVKYFNNRIITEYGKTISELSENAVNQTTREPVKERALAIVKGNNGHYPASFEEIDSLEPAAHEQSFEQLTESVQKAYKKAMTKDTTPKERKKAIDSLAKEKAYDTLATIALSDVDNETNFRAIAELLVKKNNEHAKSGLLFLKENHPSEQWRKFVSSHLEDSNN